MVESPLQAKSFAFALRVVNATKTLQRDRHEYILSKQLVRAATSIGAQIEEAQGAASRKDFINKLQIGYKEARETNYWLRLLEGANYLSPTEAASLKADLDEVLAILVAVLKTTKSTDNQ